MLLNIIELLVCETWLFLHITFALTQPSASDDHEKVLQRHAFYILHRKNTAKNSVKKHFKCLRHAEYCYIYTTQVRAAAFITGQK